MYLRYIGHEGKPTHWAIQSDIEIGKIYLVSEIHDGAVKVYKPRPDGYPESYWINEVEFKKAVLSNKERVKARLKEIERIK